MDFESINNQSISILVSLANIIKISFVLLIVESKFLRSLNRELVKWIKNIV